MHHPERNSNEFRYPGSQSRMSTKCHEDFYLSEVNWSLSINVQKAKLPADVGRHYYLAGSGQDVRVSGQVRHDLPSVLDGLSLLKDFLHLVVGIASHVLRDELGLDGAWPEGHHGHTGLLQLEGAVGRHPVAGSLANTIGHVEQILEASTAGHIDDQSLLSGDHHLGGQSCADVVTSQTHSIDHVPGTDGLRLPELLPGC